MRVGRRTSFLSPGRLSSRGSAVPLAAASFSEGSFRGSSQRPTLPSSVAWPPAAALRSTKRSTPCWRLRSSRGLPGHPRGLLRLDRARGGSRIPEPGSRYRSAGRSGGGRLSRGRPALARSLARSFPVRFSVLARRHGSAPQRGGPCRSGRRRSGGRRRSSHRCLANRTARPADAVAAPGTERHWLSWCRCPRPTRYCPTIASIERSLPDRQVDKDVSATSGPSSSFVRRAGS